MSTVTEIMPVSSSIEEYNKTASALAELSRMYAGVRYDVTVKDGLVAATKARAELRTLRVALEKTRVQIKAPALKRTQEIDSEAKRLTAAIVALEDPIDEQIKAEEQRKENARLAVERAEKERIEAEQLAIREAEQRRIDAANAEIQRRQEELDKMEREREAQEYAVRLRIEAEERNARLAREEQDRLARLAREEEERKARALREEQDRIAQAERDKAASIARGIQEAKELELQRERNRLAEERLIAEEAQRAAREAADLLARKEQAKKDAAQRIIEEKKRRAKEQEEEKQREIARRANNVLDATTMLETFVERFGQLEEFAPITESISQFLKSR